MSNIEKLFPIFSGMITLATAWLGYRAALSKRDNPTNEPKENKIVRFKDPTIRVHPWNMQKIKYLFVLPAIVYAILWLIFSFVTHDPLGEIFIRFVIIAVILLLGMIPFSFMRDSPPSRTIKTAEFTVKDNREKIISDCLHAMKKNGVQVGEFDAKEGVIVGQTRMTWRSHGEIIKIEVGRSSQKGISIQVTSDSIAPSTIFDFGANARNIQGIKAELLR